MKSYIYLLHKYKQTPPKNTDILWGYLLDYERAILQCWNHDYCIIQEMT